MLLATVGSLMLNVCARDGEELGVPVQESLQLLGQCHREGIS